MLNLALALAFAKRGFHVFPLYKSPNPSSERPWIEPKGWNRFRDGLPTDGRVEPQSGELPATTDEPTISSWSKNASVIGYGLCSPYHVIFDLDVKNGKNGIAEFQKLKQKYTIPDPSVVVRTKSGGLHLYYDREKDFVTAKVGKATDLVVEGVSYPGVDLIVNSGYVVGPNEKGPKEDWSEGKYLLVKGAPESEMTQCPFGILRGQIRGGNEVRVVAQGTTADELITNEWQGSDDELAAVIKTGKIPDKIPAGKRDSLLTSFIGVLKSRRIPKDTARVLCEKFLDNCELAVGETKEAFLSSIALEGKLNRFYSVQGDSSDPRVVARELVEVGKTFKLVDQLHGAMAIISMADNPYLTSRVVYTETKARQDLAPYARTIPDSDAKKTVNPYDLIMKDASVPKVHSVGYRPVSNLTYVDPADGLERVNMYVPPIIPLGASKRSRAADLLKDLVKEVCGEMAEYYFDFMAHVVQKPHIKMGNALLIVSNVHGSGKNTLVQVMKPLVGPKNYLPVSGLMPLVEDKSIILEGNVLVVFNEVSRPANRGAWSDMAKAISKIKTAITESSTQINPKYEKQRTITTYSNFVMLSNHNTPFDLELGDRRIAVINNDPPKLDQSRFGMIADFAHNEKNQIMSPRQYEDLVYEFHEFFSSWKIVNNVTTGDAPASRAKVEMFGSLEPPAVQALRQYHETGGAGATAAVTCEDKLVYIMRTVLGFKDFGRNRDRYDVWEQFVSHGLLHRVHRQSDPKKARVVDGLPNMRDREDFPWVSRPIATPTPQRVFTWSDCGAKFDQSPNSILKDHVWSDIDALGNKDGARGRADVVSLISK